MFQTMGKKIRNYMAFRMARLLLAQSFSNAYMEILIQYLYSHIQRLSRLRRQLETLFRSGFNSVCPSLTRLSLKKVFFRYCSLDQNYIAE